MEKLNISIAVDVLAVKHKNGTQETHQHELGNTTCL